MLNFDFPVKNNKLNHQGLDNLLSSGIRFFPFSHLPDFPSVGLSRLSGFPGLLKNKSAKCYNLDF
jgi:hypothetical protein